MKKTGIFAIGDSSEPSDHYQTILDKRSVASIDIRSPTHTASNQTLIYQETPKVRMGTGICDNNSLIDDGAT